LGGRLGLSQLLLRRALLSDRLDELGEGAGDDLFDLPLVGVGVGEDRDLGLADWAEDRDLTRLEARERLMLGQAAVGRAGDRRVGAAAAVGEDRHAAAVEGFLAL